MLLLWSAGCGSNNAVTVATGTTATAPAQTTDIRLVSTLETPRTVAVGITGFRLVGQTPAGDIVYSVYKDKAAEVLFADVPTDVTVVRIEYLAKGVLAGLAVVDVKLVPDVEYVITDPDFQDVGLVVSALSVTPVNPSVPLGASQQFVATGTRATGGTLNLTDTVNWSSANTANVSIDQAGKAKGLALGDSQITGTYGSLSASTTLTVTPAVLASLRIEQGDTLNTPLSKRTYSAVGVYTDGTEVDLGNRIAWSTDNSAAVDIDAGTGACSFKGSTGDTAHITATDSQTNISTDITAHLGQYLYVCVTNDTLDPTNPTKVRGFRIDTSNGELSKVDDEIVSNSPVGLAIHPSGRFLYLARTGGGNNFIDIYKVNLSDGTLTLADSVEATGSNLAAVAMSGDGKTLFTSYGSNARVESYSVAQDTGALTFVDSQSFFSSFTFPLTLFAHPTLPFAYASETSRGLHGVAADNGALSYIPGSPARAKYGGQGPFLYSNNLAASRDGKFLFAPNTSTVGKGVVTFSIDNANGKLSQLFWRETPQFPEVIALDPDESTIFAIEGVGREIYTMPVANDGSLTVGSTTSVTAGAGRIREVAMDSVGRYFYLTGEGTQTLVPVLVDRTTKALSFGTAIPNQKTSALVLTP